MKDQPWDLKQTWPVGRKWCQFTNAPKNFGGPPQHWGAKTSNFGPLFRNFRTRHRISHISGTKCRINKQKRHCQFAMCSLKLDLLSVVFEPETAEIRLLIVTHPMQIQPISVITGLPTQSPLNPGQPNSARC